MECHSVDKEPSLPRASRRKRRSPKRQAASCNGGSHAPASQEKAAPSEPKGSEAGSLVWTPGVEEHSKAKNQKRESKPAPTRQAGEPRSPGKANQEAMQNHLREHTRAPMTRMLLHEERCELTQDTYAINRGRGQSDTPTPQREANRRAAKTRQNTEHRTGGPGTQNNKTTRAQQAPQGATGKKEQQDPQTREIVSKDKEIVPSQPEKPVQP